MRRGCVLAAQLNRLGSGVSCLVFTIVNIRKHLSVHIIISAPFQSVVSVALFLKIFCILGAKIEVCLCARFGRGVLKVFFFPK